MFLRGGWLIEAQTEPPWETSVGGLDALQGSLPKYWHEPRGADIPVWRVLLISSTLFRPPNVRRLLLRQAGKPAPQLLQQAPGTRAERFGQGVLVANRPQGSPPVGRGVCGQTQRAPFSALHGPPTRRTAKAGPQPPASPTRQRAPQRAWEAGFSLAGTFQGCDLGDPSFRVTRWLVWG
jgi:hypothetical protein